MKLYYYFLFRLYIQLEIKHKDEKTAILLTTSTSTLILYLIIFGLVGCYSLFVSPINLPNLNKLNFTFLMALIGFANYYLFIRDRKFLNFNFRQDRSGGYYVVLFMILLLIAVSALAITSGDRKAKEEYHSR